MNDRVFFRGGVFENSEENKDGEGIDCCKDSLPFVECAEHDTGETGDDGTKPNDDDCGTSRKTFSDKTV